MGETKVIRALISICLLSLALSGEAAAETVDVKYRGPVDLKPFKCSSVDRSSLVNRVCYDAKEQYMIISLQGVYYHYCEIDASTVSQLLRAESMGRYFNAAIKGRYDCRSRKVPAYR